MALNAPGEFFAVTAQTRLLVVAPHPDDETLANGLLIQRVHAAGGTVRVLLLTDGDNNPWPQRWLERRWSIGAAERARWGHRRRAECGEALRQLGVPPSALQPLGWPDMGLLGCLLQPEGRPLATLTTVLDDFAPNLVAMPALADRHPDHGAAHVLARMAAARSGCPATLLGYLIHGQEGGLPVFESTGTPAWQAAKQKALAAYGTQLALSGGRLRQWAERPERHMRIEPPPPGAARTLPWRPSSLLWPRLRLTAASTGGEARQWPWLAAPLRQDGQGGWQLDWPAARTEGSCFVRLSLALPSPWIFDHWGWCEL
ncbi:PIG-L family deacetylase [Rhodanobacter sp. DHG33]|uniref:PIG-L deacetylase family protein n=1 Tax=Rhodanobacter sp. DHG33 TaxID=2775921 RepID=UPI00177BEE22|nr:PIG-L family deacetylase [Rhodanobacter sp. DHG33]MBD8898230.1 PIG-L family deacetylase [Rhodanobacter sp. DHG33]